MRSPNKPTSILLTPGTGTARRKRVSFGHDVKAGNNAETGFIATNPDGSRRKTTLQQALENSRSSRSKLAAQNGEQSEEPPATLSENNDGADSESEWEDDVCNHDVTVDLNEPHSNSGKYWKSEFSRYHDEAQSEMDKLVRYKHMAKSYAKKKDAEAINLTQRLKDEQEKVRKMEQKITEMASQVADKRKQGANKDSETLIKDLAKQTTLAIQYRDQVKGLEAMLNGQQDDAGSHRPRIDTSPRTEKTILETNRELRRLRSELRQMESIREENKQLKSDLSIAQQEAKKLVEDDKQGKSTVDTGRMQRLEKHLREAKDDLRQRDSEIRRLNRDYESLKKDAKARTAEAMQVLQEKNDKIGQLEKEIRTLKAEIASSSRHKSIDTALAEHNNITRDLKSRMESLRKPSKHETTAATRRREPRQRSMSVEDITLDMTQRSLLGGRNTEKQQLAPDSNAIRPPLPSTYSDWTIDLKNTEDQLRKVKAKETMTKLDRETFTDTLDLGPLAATVAAKAPTAHHPQHHPSSFSSRRAIMSDRVNESTPVDNDNDNNNYYYGGSGASPTKERRPSSYHHRAPTSTGTNTARASSRGAAARDNNNNKNPMMHGALLAKPAASGRQERITSNSSSRAAASGADGDEDVGPSQNIDLFKDRFARLGGGGGGGAGAGGLGKTTDGGMGLSVPGTANTSRCTLPADRQAAARARLEQKKLERLREKEKENGHGNGRERSRGRERAASRVLVDKENLVPC